LKNNQLGYSKTDKLISLDLNNQVASY